MKTKTTRALCALLTLPACLASLLLAQRDDEDEIFELSPFCVASGGFGVTAGGAQDIGYTRSQIAMGNIPMPSTFTAEGLLSEYDLPLQNPTSCSDLICVYGEAMPALLPELPEATHLAQIGFASGIDATSWERPPLNLIAVIDKSGSMSGRPLNLVRQSLLEILDQLGERDQLSIVLYGDRSHVYLEATPTSRYHKQRIRESILAIASSGSTNMESGLQVGYSLADRTAPDFQGSTRLMLFTDEQPNTGNTSEAGFMRQMRDGSEKGYGLTTIGVGANFGAELANTISSVRGGNLFFFPDASTMQKKFAAEFDTMVTELAYDMTLTLTPAPGYAIAGVYGIPGDMLKWTGDGRSLYMEVETLFLSLRQGAIYFALAPESKSHFAKPSSKNLKDIAQASLSYQVGNQGFPISQKISLALRDPSEASIGLVRGVALVDEYISLKKATSLYHDNGDSQQAYQIVQALAERFRNLGDAEIKPERKLIKEIEKNLAIVAGEDRSLFEQTNDSPLRGAWIAEPQDNPDLDSATLVTFHSGRVVEITELSAGGSASSQSFAVTADSFSKRRHGELRLIEDSSAYRLAKSSDAISELAETSHYLEDVSRIVYKVRGESLTLSVYDENNEQSAYVVLRKSAEDEPSSDPRYRAQRDAATGLPTRG